MFFGGLEIANQDRFVKDVMPLCSIACVFAVPSPVFRPDVKIIYGATLHIDESRLEGLRANLTLRRREIFACNAGALLLASQQTDEDDLGPVEPETLENYLQGAENIGITLPQPLWILSFSTWYSAWFWFDSADSAVRRVIHGPN